MTGASLDDLFARQVRRLWPEVLAQLDPDPLAAARRIHLLKGAALALANPALVSALHALESPLAAGRSPEPVQLSALDALLQPWRMSPAVSPDVQSLRQAVRSGFVQALREAPGPAVLHLDIQPVWLNHADALLVVLPQLLRNALAHGGEPASQRLAAGKPAALQVRVRGGQLGDRQVLTVSDDGRGMPSHERPADALAGRGWGVAAVREQVALLPDGRLAYRARPARGSCARITCAGLG